jgi:membrane associated rhomboid family serine protease
MGLESRDYARDGSYTASLSSWGMDLTPVVKWLVIMNVAVFLLQVFLTRSAPPQAGDFDGAFPDEEEATAEAEPGDRTKAPGTPEERRKHEEAARKAREAMQRMMAHMPGMRTSVIQEWFELDPRKTVEQGQVWRLLTSTFCHDRYGLWHILFNMLILCWFGQRLERMYGSREFLLFYLAAAVCASLAFVGLAYYTGSYVPAIGASGPIMAVMMVYTIFYPFEQFLLFWFFPVPLWALLGLYMLYDLHPVLLALAGDPMFTGVAHGSHLGGLAFGFFYWRFGWRLEPVLDRIAPAVAGAGTRIRARAGTPSRPGALRKPVILPIPPRDHELAERLDEVLKKISEQGKDSLTDEEREILIRASAKYRGGK